MEPKSNYEIFCHVSDDTLSLIKNCLNRHDKQFKQFGTFPCFAVKSSNDSLALGMEIKKECQLKDGESFMVQQIGAGVTGSTIGTIIFYADTTPYYANREMAYITSVTC